MLVSASIPFPAISWWQQTIHHNKVLIDVAENYQKMSFRNRYYIASPQGKLLLSIPLQMGRNQRKPVQEVRIDYKEKWQARHWKTIVSCYHRSPFFEYFEYLFRSLYEDQYELLHEWNKTGVNLIKEILQLKINIAETSIYQRQYAGDVTDIRESFVPQAVYNGQVKEYYQVFSDRTGFIPDCSVLDLIFCEGKQSMALLHAIDSKGINTTGL